MISQWALQSLFRGRMALVGSVAAIAASLVLIILFEAIWRGEAEKIVSYARHTDADVWVMQRGVSNMHMASSFLPVRRRDEVARVQGVATVTPILYLTTLVQAGNKPSFSYVVGRESGSLRGGPWSMASGKPDPGPGEAVIPDVLSKLTGVGLGGKIRVADRELTVAGLSQGTFSMVNTIVFVHASDLESLLSIQGYDSYLAVKAGPGIVPEQLARRIRESVAGVSVLTRDEFVSNDLRMSMQMGIEIIGLITGIGTALAALLVGYTLYTQAVRLRREYAILKALGFRNRHLLAGLGLQSIGLYLLGFFLALGLAFAGQALISAWVPQVAVRITGHILLKAALIGFAVVFPASIIPWRKISGVDPHSVFQS